MTDTVHNASANSNATAMREKPHLSGLRLNDLIAKIARVTLKDTTRVLLALDTVVDFLDCPTDSILETEFVVERPTAAEAETCAQAYSEVEKYLAEAGDADWLKKIRAID